MNEGLIRFKIDRWDQTKELNYQYWAPVEKVRRRLFELGLVGWNERSNVGFGNVSRRCTPTGQFVITGSQTGLMPNLNGFHYTLIKKCDFKKFSVNCEGPVKPSSESLTHGIIYQLDKTINFIAHVHHAGLWRNLLEAGFIATEKEAEYGSEKLFSDIKKIIKTNPKYNKPEVKIIVLEGHEEGIIFAAADDTKLLERINDIYNLYK